MGLSVAVLVSSFQREWTWKTRCRDTGPIIPQHTRYTGVLSLYCSCRCELSAVTACDVLRTIKTIYFFRRGLPQWHSCQSNAVSTHMIRCVSCIYEKRWVWLSILVQICFFHSYWCAKIYACASLPSLYINCIAASNAPPASHISHYWCDQPLTLCASLPASSGVETVEVRTQEELHLHQRGAGAAPDMAL